MQKLKMSFYGCPALMWFAQINFDMVGWSFAENAAVMRPVRQT
jgi:hypothetical protein